MNPTPFISIEHTKKTDFFFRLSLFVLHNRTKVMQVLRGISSPYLASPKHLNKIALIPENIKNFKDSSRIPKHSNAGIRNGKVESQEILWFQRLSLLG